MIAVTTACVAALPIATQSANAPVPVGQDGQFVLLKNWTFGSAAEATVHNKQELAKEFYFRYIYAGGTLDGLTTYWSYHRDYPEGDPRSLHVFTGKSLVLKGHIPPGGGLWPRGIETGMLRGKFPITPGTYIEMRARLPSGIGAWPAFWLGAGVQYDDKKFSDLPWPPEIDIFEFFNWQGRPQTRVLTGNIQTNGHPDRYGMPRDLWTKFNKGEYDAGIDFSADFHVFALDWRENKPIWLLDGKPIKQTYYEWRAPPAHLLVTNQLGMTFKTADLSAMKPDEHQWDYEINYIRVWKVKDGEPLPPDRMHVK